VKDQRSLGRLAAQSSESEKYCIGNIFSLFPTMPPAGAAPVRSKDVRAVPRQKHPEHLAAQAVSCLFIRKKRMPGLSIVDLSTCCSK
jgi:hypothetical protein